MADWENLVDDDSKRLFDDDDENEVDASDFNTSRWQRAPEQKLLREYDEVNDVWRTREPVLYPPERGPPILDFLSVFAAFIVALIAAYYTIT
jgi:hypothetical protein